MKNEILVKEWIDFANMDFDTAMYLHQNMIPEPLEIVCYHCQQFAEKILKALLIIEGFPVAKTHDLGVLAAQLEEKMEIPEYVLDACDNLSPYGVKVRYPRELLVEDHHVKQAVRDAEIIKQWSADLLN